MVQCDTDGGDVTPLLTPPVSGVWCGEDGAVESAVSPDGVGPVVSGGRAADGDLCDVPGGGGAGRARLMLLLRVADAAGHTQLLLQRTGRHCRDISRPSDDNTHSRQTIHAPREDRNG